MSRDIGDHAPCSIRHTKHPTPQPTTLHKILHHMWHTPRPPDAPTSNARLRATSRVTAPPQHVYQTPAHLPPTPPVPSYWHIVNPCPRPHSHHLVRLKKRQHYHYALQLVPRRTNRSEYRAWPHDDTVSCPSCQMVSEGRHHAWMHLQMNDICSKCVSFAKV